LNINSLNK